jgi:GNAT superfamily N-acetyltransferase
MKITFVPSSDLGRAANFTFENMRGYYALFAPDWNAEKVLEVTKALVNYDIQLDNQTVGVMRLQFEDNTYVLRDLQVIPSAQNRGIGSAAIKEAEKLAVAARVNSLTLRVFKISPAVSLYNKVGFVVSSEDDRFYNMVKSLNN